MFGTSSKLAQVIHNGDGYCYCHNDKTGNKKCTSNIPSFYKDMYLIHLKTEKF